MLKARCGLPNEHSLGAFPRPRASTRGLCYFAAPFRRAHSNGRARVARPRKGTKTMLDRWSAPRL